MDELTAAENVELPALLAGGSARSARSRATRLLEEVGVVDRAAHLPPALSGGQRQRVAISRALMNEPLVVLADEPTGNLDSTATVDVLRLFKQLRAAGETIVIVTHDERVAATADRLISMRDGVFVDQTRLTGGTGGLGDLAGLRARPWEGPLLLGRLAYKDLRRHLARGAAVVGHRRGGHHVDAGPDPSRRDRQSVQLDPNRTDRSRRRGQPDAQLGGERGSRRHADPDRLGEPHTCRRGDGLQRAVPARPSRAGSRRWATTAMLEGRDATPHRWTSPISPPAPG